MIEGRIALAKSDGVAETFEDRQELAEAPDAGVVESLGGAAALSPQPLQGTGIGPVVSLSLAPAWILDFKQITAQRAAEVRPGLSAHDPRSASETA